MGSGYPCSVCGRPAAFHETRIENGAVVHDHLCREHGEAGWRREVLSRYRERSGLDGGIPDEQLMRMMGDRSDLVARFDRWKKTFEQWRNQHGI